MKGRIERIAAARVARASARLARVAGEALPEDRVEDHGAGIAIRGAGLVRRLAFDARLRGLGALAGRGR